MADTPKATPMDFRTAEKITRLDRDTYADRVWLDVCVRRGDDDARDDRLDANAVYTKAQADWNRARAIVDAAVEAHEADCKDDDVPGDYDTLMKAINARKKLRALERGESEAQP